MLHPTLDEEKFPKFDDNHAWPNRWAIWVQALVLITLNTVLLAIVFDIIGLPAMVVYCLFPLVSILVIRWKWNARALIVISHEGYVVRQWREEHRSLLIAMLKPDQFAIVLNIYRGTWDKLRDQPWYQHPEGPDKDLFEQWLRVWVRNGRELEWKSLVRHGEIFLDEVVEYLQLLKNGALNWHNESLKLYMVVHYLGGTKRFRFELARIRAFHDLVAEHEKEVEKAKDEGRESGSDLETAADQRLLVRTLFSLLGNLLERDRMANSIQGVEYELILLAQISGELNPDRWWVRPDETTGTDHDQVMLMHAALLEELNTSPEAVQKQIEQAEARLKELNAAEARKRPKPKPNSDTAAASK